MFVQEGVPANENPFCIIAGNDIADGAFSMIAPQYFIEKDGRYVCPIKVESPALTQEEAEEMVRKLMGQNVVYSLAVKVDFIHIVPPIKEKILVALDWDPKTGECPDESGCFEW